MSKHMAVKSFCAFIFGILIYLNTYVKCTIDAIVSPTETTSVEIKKFASFKQFRQFFLPDLF